jgi:hypothetical protein
MSERPMLMALQGNPGFSSVGAKLTSLEATGEADRSNPQAHADCRAGTTFEHLPHRQNLPVAIGSIGYLQTEHTPPFLEQCPQ